MYHTFRVAELWATAEMLNFALLTYVTNHWSCTRANRLQGFELWTIRCAV